MGKKSTPAPPPAPDPTVVANAQSAANIATAQAQQKLNMVNTYGPDGSVTYQSDPNAPGGYSQTTSLSPGQQGIYDQGVAAQNAALGIANQQIGRVGDALGQTLNMDGLPGLVGSVSGGPIQTSFNQGGQLQYGFNPGQQVQGHVGPADLNAASQQAQQAVYGQAASRLDPQWGLRQQQLNTDLANQGLGQNSTAYQNAQAQFGRDRNDAYNQANYSAVTAGNQAAQQLFDQSLQQGTFANQAAAQQYAQNQGQAAFNNQTAGQDYQQNLGSADFANQAQNQAFGQAYNNAQLSNMARNQGMQERAYIQNQPLNQFNSLMSSSQVSTPQGIQYTPSQVQPTDVLGAYALNQQAQQSAYQAQMANQQSNMGGLFKLGASILTAPMTGGGSLLGNFIGSDERLKTDIRRVGTLDNGVPVYSYRYKAGGPPQIGVMAHELARVRPDAVAEIGGFLAVHYGAL